MVGATGEGELPGPGSEDDSGKHGGIYRAKQHIVGGYRNVQACKKCPEHVKEEIREYTSKKKEEKEHTNLLSDFDDMDDQDEDDVTIIDVKGKRVASGTGSSNIQSKKQKQKGPIDLYFTPPPEVVVQNRKNDKSKQTTIDNACKKELRNRACQRFARWMYDAGISFNALNYDSFAPVVEAIGQHSPGMKPSSYHEVRVPLLKKKLEHTDNLMRDHKEEWAKYGCTIMADGWEDKRHSKWAKEIEGKNVAQIVLMPTFWTSIVYSLKVASPLVRVLKLVDGERRPPIGYIYEAMERAKEAIAKAFGGNEEKYKDIFKIIDTRWNIQLHRPLHAVGHFLNPE
ncbi:uncharacterized protein LOC132316448 [Cornus florida]|uniref:uncharacterized protein LOC132316448 n=1 Tax=Cornus florida TaxID=4283 RepID=UPI0028A17350|nr:uncharacterized protein LOC132316448 [Cornus florida]